MNWKNIAVGNGIAMWLHGLLAACAYSFGVRGFLYFFVAMSGMNALMMVIAVITISNDRERQKEYQWMLRKVTEFEVEMRRHRGRNQRETHPSP